jgi:hypothetical protein
VTDQLVGFGPGQGLMCPACMDFSTYRTDAEMAAHLSSHDKEDLVWSLMRSEACREAVIADAEDRVEFSMIDLAAEVEGNVDLVCRTAAPGGVYERICQIQ